MQFYIIGCHTKIGFFTITAMINVGIGEQQMNNILAELNIPSIHHKTLKEREREVGHSKKLQINHVIWHCWMKLYVQTGITSMKVIYSIKKITLQSEFYFVMQS